MVLILYYLPASPPVRSVDLLIHTLGLAVEHRMVNLQKRENLTSEFSKVNPLHTVPAIDDEGFLLWESRAIMTYLVSKYGKDDSLYPKDLQKRAIVDQRLHYSNDVFYVFRKITVSVLYAGMKPISPELVAKIKDHQENLEKLLEGNKFIAGDTLTVADFVFISFMDLMEVYYPMSGVLKAWVQRCKSAIKDFDKINKPGNDDLTSRINNCLSA